MSVIGGNLPPPQNMPLRPWVILLVDDEPDILDSVRQIMETSLQGTTVLTARSGRIALDILDRERVDCIITDFKMPGMDGIEFLYQARKAHAHIPRVMLTAFADDDLMRRAISDVFVDEFISKAAAPLDFLSRVKRFLEYHPVSHPAGGLPGATRTG